MVVTCDCTGSHVMACGDVCLRVVMCACMWMCEIVHLDVFVVIDMREGTCVF